MLLSQQGKQTFNRIASDYDAVRPVYPTAIFDYLQRVGNWNNASRLLEIGCGSGQLTQGLGALGWQVQAIDIGEGLLTLARVRCRDYHKVSFLNSGFEEFQATPGSFAAILAATSFHWLDPKLRFAKSAELLRNNGQLFIIKNVSLHREQEGALRESLDRIYEQLIPPEITRQYISLEKQSVTLEDEFANSPFFGPLEVFSERHIHTLSADDYIRLLNTFSYQHNLPEPVKSTLFMEIRKAVEDHGGEIQLPYEARVVWASKG